MEPKLVAWVERQERVTFFRSAEDGVWTIEWFNLKARFNFMQDTNLTTLIERVIKQ